MTLRNSFHVTPSPEATCGSIMPAAGGAKKADGRAPVATRRINQEFRTKNIALKTQRTLRAEIRCGIAEGSRARVAGFGRPLIRCYGVGLGLAPGGAAGLGEPIFVAGVVDAPADSGVVGFGEPTFAAGVVVAPGGVADAWLLVPVLAF
jgi:hypothetical protein